VRVGPAGRERRPDGASAHVEANDGLGQHEILTVQSLKKARTGAGHRCQSAVRNVYCSLFHRIPHLLRVRILEYITRIDKAASEWRIRPPGLFYGVPKQPPKDAQYMVRTNPRDRRFCSCPDRGPKSGRGDQEKTLSES
jgi:hypothetical protein